jgi:predicted GNAT family N-acyltransferase
VGQTLTEVREARGDEERRAVFALRHEVFVEEQGVPLDLELDEHDDDALHLVALDGDRIVGTCRVVAANDHAKFGRLVVARDARGRGVGSALLGESERRARTGGATRMTLAAQTSAVGLYERAGYSAVGDVFLDAGIEHVTMEKALA